MPTYGYRCRSCSTEFEVWQTMRDEPRASCPSCGGASARLFFPAGIVFKGSGFYKTDSRGASSSSITSDTSSTADKSSATKADTSPGTSPSKPSDTKPASTDPTR